MTMRKPFASEVSEQLQMAFEKVDGVADRIEDLKRAYNETAKTISEIEPEMLTQITTPPPPPPTPVQVKPPPLPTIYSIPTPMKTERPFPLRPSIPRPTPKTAPKPQIAASPVLRHPSGRFYVQLAKAEDQAAFQEARDKLGKIGRVVDSGRGTASDPEAGWIEVAIRGDAGDLVAGLRDANLREQVEKVIEVKPGEGRLLARQLDIARIQSAKGR